MTPTHCHFCHFDDLSLRQLYELLTLRQLVFVVEQNCPYLDNDGKDYHAIHAWIESPEKEILACCRILRKGISYEGYHSIGRVVNHPKVRGLGLGKQIMNHAIHYIQQHWEPLPIKISAQYYLLEFYRQLGFEPVGDTYLEDDIPHIAMIHPNEA